VRGFNAELIVLFITGATVMMEIILHSAILSCCFGPQKQATSNNIIEHRIIDQLLMTQAHC
jgi:hypothetical protein